MIKKEFADKRIMKWIEAKVVFDFIDRPQAVDLISNLFHELGLQGVVIEDPEAAPDEDWGEDALDLPEQHAVIGYIRQDDKAAQRVRVFERKIQLLENKIGIKSRIFYSEIDEADWSQAWKSYFRPEKVAAGIVVKPTWCEYTPAEDEIVLEIDPGMAFGTGTHPTTMLCIEMIATYLIKGDSFLDVGMGSGILMIAAAKLGAGKLRGIDNDNEAVKIARENLLQNRIDTKTFKITAGNLVDGVDERFDLAVANISSHAVLELLDNIRAVLTHKGIFICAGMVEKNKAEVVGKMKSLGFEIMAARSKEDWVVIACKV